MNYIICNKCGRKLPATTEFFHKHKRNKYGLNTVCKECRGGSFGKTRKLVQTIPTKEGYKICTQCKTEYPATTEFFNKGGGKYGLDSKCKKCGSNLDKEYYKDKKETILKKSKEYYNNHKSTVLEKHKLWREEHKDYYIKWRKEYANTERGKEIGRLKTNRRISRIKNIQSENTLTLEEWMYCKKYFDNKCVYCGKDNCKLEQEHIIPVNKKGTYTKDNIVPACKSCNSSKKDSDLIDWWKKQSFYDKNRYKKLVKYQKIMIKEIKSNERIIK